MKAALTYEQAVADIKALSLEITDENTQKVVGMTRDFSNALCYLSNEWGGWMLFTAFTVAFIEMKKTLDAATGADKILLKEMMDSIIGSFGKTLN